MFGGSLGPSVMEWDGAGDADSEVWAKRGCWVALRDLSSKRGSPLNSGLFGIQLQGQLFGTGLGDSPAGGEVTGIGGGATGVGSKSLDNWPASPPKPRACTPALEALVVGASPTPTPSPPGG